MSNFYSVDKIKKSRKEHICDCCGSKILKDENYVKIAGKYENNFFTHILCPQCNDILQWYFDNVDNEYCLNEIIGEYWNEKEVYTLLKQIKHPSDFVKGCIEDYENKLLEDEEVQA